MTAARVEMAPAFGQVRKWVLNAVRDARPFPEQEDLFQSAREWLVTEAAPSFWERKRDPNEYDKAARVDWAKTTTTKGFYSDYDEMTPANFFQAALYRVQEKDGAAVMQAVERSSLMLADARSSDHIAVILKDASSLIFGTAARRWMATAAKELSFALTALDVVQSASKSLFDQEHPYPDQPAPDECKIVQTCRSLRFGLLCAAWERRALSLLNIAAHERLPIFRPDIQERIGDLLLDHRPEAGERLDVLVRLFGYEAVRPELLGAP